MAIQGFKSRVKVTTTSSGVGNLTLGGAVDTTWQTLDASFDGLLLDVLIEHTNGTEKEVGSYVYQHSGTVLLRGSTGTTEWSTAGGLTKQNFTAGTKHVSVSVNAASLAVIAPTLDATETPFTTAAPLTFKGMLAAGEAIPASAFGIRPGATDWTVKLQDVTAELASLGTAPATGHKRIIQFGDGTYLFANMFDQTTVMLQGNGGTVFQYNGTPGAGTYVMRCKHPNALARITYGKLRRIKINGTAPGGSMAETGYYAETALDWSTFADDLQIFGCGRYGLRVKGATNMFIRNFRCDATGTSAIVIENEDARQALFAIDGGTVTFNDPGNMANWVSQGYLAAGSVNGVAAYWGRAAVEWWHSNAQPPYGTASGSTGGGEFLSMKDFNIEWRFPGDPAGAGVIVDRNSSTVGGQNRPRRIFLNNIRGYSDAFNFGSTKHYMVGFVGTDGNQPYVTAQQASLDGSSFTSVRDFTQGNEFGNFWLTHFTWWKGGRGFTPNASSTMRGLFSQRPAVTTWLEGLRFLATDTGREYFCDGSTWLTIGVAGLPIASGPITPNAIVLGFSYPAFTQVSTVTLSVTGTYNGGEEAEVAWTGNGQTITPDGTTVKWADLFAFAKNVPNGNKDMLRIRWNAGLGHAVAWFTEATNSVLDAIELRGPRETSPTLVPSAGSLNVNLVTGNVFLVNLTENVANLSFTNIPGSGTAVECQLLLRQDSIGGRTVTWPGTVVWPGGVQPTIDATANTVTIVSLLTRDGGTTWFGTYLATGTGGGASPLITDNPKTVSGDLQLTDAQTNVRGNSSSLINLGLRLNSVVPFPIGSNMLISRSGSGDVTVVPDSGVTVEKPADRYLTLRKQFSITRLIKRGTDTWEMDGDLGLYKPNAVTFTTGTRLDRGGALSGVGATGIICGAFTIKLRGAASDQHIFSIGPTTPKFVIGRSATNQIYLFGTNSATATVLDVRTQATLPIDFFWNICFRIFLTASPPVAAIWVDDSISPFVAGGTITQGALLDLPGPSASVGDFASSSGKQLIGELADLWITFGGDIDYFVLGTRRRFFTGDGNIADKGPNGNLAVGITPHVFLSGPTSSWATNKGSAGGFNTVGALGTASPLPDGPLYG